MQVDVDSRRSIAANLQSELVDVEMDKRIRKDRKVRSSQQGKPSPTGINSREAVESRRPEQEENIRKVAKSRRERKREEPDQR